MLIGGICRPANRQAMGCVELRGKGATLNLTLERWNLTLGAVALCPGVKCGSLYVCGGGGAGSRIYGNRIYGNRHEQGRGGSPSAGEKWAEPTPRPPSEAEGFETSLISQT